MTTLRIPQLNNPEMPYINQASRIPGTIRCRLRASSRELRQALSMIDNFWYWYSSEASSSTQVDDLGCIANDQWIKIPGLDQCRDSIEKSTSTPGFFRLPHEFHSSSRTLILAVTMKTGSRERSPLSGFPVTTEALLQRAAMI